MTIIYKLSKQRLRLGFRVGLLSLMLGFAQFAMAQVSVTATNGNQGPSNYTTVNAAFVAINAGTHQGAITITVTANTTEPTYAAANQLLASGVGSSSYTSILIKPQGNVTINSAATPTASRAILEFIGADNVTIDGDDPNTTGDRNLTIQVATTSSSNTAALRFSSSSTTTNGCLNITVKNCNIVGGRNSATTTTISYGIFSGLSSATATITTTTGAANNDNMLLENNNITRCSYGIYTYGLSGYVHDNLVIRNNIIGTAVRTSIVSARGILTAFTQSTAGANSVVIEGNDIRIGDTLTGYSTTLAAIDLATNNAGALIRNNNIHDVAQPNASGNGAYGIFISVATNNANIRIYNNFIRDVTASHTTSSPSALTNHGIYSTANVAGLRILHNTIVLNRRNAGNGSANFSSCIYLSNTSLSLAEFRNNILVNNQSDNTGQTCLNVYLGAATAFANGAAIDRNNYWVSGVSGYVGRIGIDNYTSLVGFKTVTLKDSNSLSVLPNFVSATNLRLQPGVPSLLESAGDTTWVSADFDGDVRPGPTGSINGGGFAPDLGADESDMQLQICQGQVAAGTVVGNSLVCGGTPTTLWLQGATIGLGLSYQWQSSPDSINWTNITGATSSAVVPLINNDSFYFRCEVTCNAGTPELTSAFLVKADVFEVTVATPYEEGFESITAYNQMPSCMAATNFGTIITTYTAPTGSDNQFARTGTNFASFRYFCNDFFFTKGLKLTQGVTYSFSTWFITDGYTGSWDSVALYVATGITPNTATLLPGTTLIQPSNVVYQKITGSFTAPSTGFYRFAFKVVDAGNPMYLSIDDIKVEVAQAPTITTGNSSYITTNSATLSGNILYDGGAATSATGVVVGTSPNPTRGAFGVIDSATNPATGMGPFSVNVGGLNLSTTYYYRAYAVNSIGITYGADSTFTTNFMSVPPTVLTTKANNVLAYTASIGGNIVSNGGDAVITSGIVYSTSPNPIQFGIGVVDSATTPVVTFGTFNINPAGLAHSTKYYYRAYASNSVGTSYSVEDSFTTAPIISNLPYFQNFDTTINSGWTSAPVTGNINDWVIGTPAKAVLSAAFSAPNAMVTNLTANYSTSVHAAITSPQIDFGTLTGNPILRFKHKFYTESCCDGGWLEMSINGGAWSRVENTVGTGANFNTANGTAWYNSTAQGPSWGDNSNSYSTATNGWITSSIALQGAAGQSNVKIRFVFATDGSIEYDGWAIDDIELFVPSAPTVITGTSTNITTSSASVSGNITHNGGNTITASGVVVSTFPNPTRGGFGVVDSATNPLVTGGNYSIDLTGLFLSTTYYYRSYAVNALGTSYGADSMFTTNAQSVVPTVLTNTPVSVTTNTATLRGNITSDGGDPIFASGVIYSTIPNPLHFGVGVVDAATNPVITNGTFSLPVAGLAHSTKYYFRAYATNTVGTAYSIEDSFITSPVISALPYNQNFDAFGSTGWISTIVGGMVNDWVIGTPSKPILAASFSSPNSLITRLTGTYSSSHDAAMVSPQFDFSTVSTDPVLRFKHKFITGSCCDGGYVEVSINNGAWTKLVSVVGTGANFNTPNAFSWYNSNTQGNSWSNNSNAYSTQSNGWIESAARITGAANQSNVRFRFRFVTDGSVENDGWAIDDIEVVEVTTPTTAASNVTVTPSATSATVNFTAGNGQGRMVVARLSSTLAVAPTNNTLYGASAAFGSANTTGTGNFIVYMGNGTSVNVTGLTQLTGYTFDVYEYNGKYMHNSFAGAISSNTTTTPVKLVSLKATKVNNDVLVSWITASEVNNRGFNVERSIDGKTFEYVGFVKGAGNSSVTNNYRLQDANAFVTTGVSKLYYRLKQMDNDGKFEYSKVVTVENNERKAETVITYPNPFSDKVTVELQNVNAGTVKVEVLDISGRLVTTVEEVVNQGTQTITVNGLSGLTQGVYMVRVTASGVTQTSKLIKQ